MSQQPGTLDELMQAVSLAGLQTVTEQDTEILRVISAAVHDIRLGHEHRLRGMRALRQLLSSSSCEQSIDAILDSGITPIVVHFLDVAAEGNSAELLHEASWTLLNLVVGSESQVLRVTASANVEAAAVALIRNEEEVSLGTREHAAWCLANIAATGHTYRMHLLDTYRNILPHVVRLAEACVQESFPPTNVIWSVGVLIRDLGGQSVDSSYFAELLPRITRIGGTCGMFEPLLETLRVVSTALQQASVMASTFPHVLMETVRFLAFVGSKLPDVTEACQQQVLLHALCHSMSLISGADDATTMRFFVRGGLLHLTWDLAHRTLSPQNAAASCVQEHDVGGGPPDAAVSVSHALANFAATTATFELFQQHGEVEFVLAALTYNLDVLTPGSPTLSLKLVRELVYTWLNLCVAAVEDTVVWLRMFVASAPLFAPQSSHRQLALICLYKYEGHLWERYLSEVQHRLAEQYERLVVTGHPTLRDEFTFDFMAPYLEAAVHASAQ